MAARGQKPSLMKVLPAPLADDVAQRAQVVSATGPVGRRPVLLIADDEALVRRVLERLARKMGYEVLACETGTEAIQVATERRPDVALVDLRMPGADGLSVLRAVRSDVPELAVIIMTAYAAIDSAVEAIKLGAREYMPKPLDFAALRAMLSDLRAEIQSDMGSTLVRPAETAAEPTACQSVSSGEGAAERQTDHARRTGHLLLVRSSDLPPAAKAVRPASLLRAVQAPGSPTPQRASDLNGDDLGSGDKGPVPRRRPGSRRKTRS